MFKHVTCQRLQFRSCNLDSGQCFSTNIIAWETWVRRGTVAWRKPEPRDRTHPKCQTQTQNVAVKRTAEWTLGDRGVAILNAATKRGHRQGSEEDRRLGYRWTRDQLGDDLTPDWLQDPEATAPWCRGKMVPNGNRHQGSAGRHVTTWPTWSRKQWCHCPIAGSLVFFFSFLGFSSLPLMCLRENKGPLLHMAASDPGQPPISDTRWSKISPEDLIPMLSWFWKAGDLILFINWGVEMLSLKMSGIPAHHEACHPHHGVLMGVTRTLTLTLQDILRRSGEPSCF